MNPALHPILAARQTERPPASSDIKSSAARTTALLGVGMILLSTLVNASTFHVSPTGDDTNPGTQDAPFATLERARDAARASASPRTVILAPGTYRRTATFELDERDSHTTYRSHSSHQPASITGSVPAEGASVSLMGGISIDPAAFKPVTDEAVLERLVESARGRVLQYPLAEHQKRDGSDGAHVVNLLEDGVMFTMRMPVPELFFNDKPLPFSRWPNDGWATYGKVIDKGSVPRFGETPDRPGILAYPGDRPDRWNKAKRILIHGYFAHDWFDDILVVDKLDTEQKHMTFTTPHMYGLAPNKRFRALGLLEEIDEPGEWMIDHATGTLYLYPPENMAAGRFQLSLLKDPMIRLTGTQHVTIRGLTLEANAGMAVEIAGGSDNLIANCTIRNVGGCGVLIRPAGYEVRDPGGLHQFPEATGDPLKDGRRNGVSGCTLYHIGTTGISMIGGDRKTLEPAEHFAVNNDIHHYARIQRANQPGINMNGVGHRAAHNFIHDAPHVGLDYSGNDHVIEFNEFTRVCQETGDVGVIYSGRDWTYRGNVVRYNYIHNIQAPGLHGSNAVYLDDTSSSTHIHGNVFYKVQKAVLLGGGRDNIMENNLIVDSQIGLYFDNRSEGWAHKYQKRGGDHRLYERLAAVNHDQPPFSTRWPELARILDENPHQPRGNKIQNNMVVRTPRWIHASQAAQRHLIMGDNLITNEDPGFVDVANGDFTLKDIAAIQAKLPDFQPIPFEKIGLRPGEYRERENPDE